MMNRPPEKTPRTRHRCPSAVVAAAIALVALLTVISPAAGGSPQVPTMPTNVYVAAATATSVPLTWTSSTVTNPNRQIVAYDLYNDVVKVDSLTNLSVLKYTF